MHRRLHFLVVVGDGQALCSYSLSPCSVDGQKGDGKKATRKKNSPTSFVTTARSSARHWVGCPFQARLEWTVTGTVGQAELQPGVPILCMTIEERKERKKGKKERAQRQKEEGGKDEKG